MFAKTRRVLDAIGVPLSQRAKAYRDDCAGNVGMIFAISLIPLIIAVGAAVDYSQLSSDVQTGQDTADAAVLSAAREFYADFTSDDAISTAQTSAKSHLERKSGDGERSVTTEVSQGDSGILTFTSTVSGTTEHAFMGIAGTPETEWTTSASSEVAIPNFEIIFMIDFSSSMTGSKGDALQSALNRFNEDVDPFRTGFSHIAITLLPYGENLNFGPDADVWVESNSDIEFNGCFVFDEFDRPGSMEAYPGNSNSNRPYCHSDLEAVLFSQDIDSLKAGIDRMTTGFGTNSYRTLVWADRFLDNDWRNSAAIFAAQQPRQISSDTKKIIVMLTDGNISVNDNDYDGEQDRNRERSRNNGRSVENFAAECESLKEIENLSVYAVGYDLDDSGQKNLLKDCISGDGAYFDADIDDLDFAFERIKNSLIPIRLTK